jgi:hypothetical protein
VIFLATVVLASGVMSSTVELGYASQYAPGVMQNVIRNRQNGC